MLVEEGRDMEVIGEARNGREAVELSGKLHPDVVLMDIVMPLMGGAAATRQLLKSNPKARVLALSSYSADECVQDLLEAGAAGYLTKHSASEELLQAIRDVHQGSAYFSTSTIRSLRKRGSGSASLSTTPVPHLPLSRRETEVLKLLAVGMPNKQIADVLHISIKTVEKHRQQLIDKLDLHDTASLTRYAVERGFVSAGPFQKSGADRQLRLFST